MLKNPVDKNPDKIVVYILLVVFIVIEILDVFLDGWLENSLLHFVLRLFLFLFLFIITYRIFISYSNKKINKMISEDLMEILGIIKSEGRKGIMINQRKMRELLGITKPTLKKRVEALLELRYVTFEKRGNHRYFVLTELGESFFE